MPHIIIEHSPEVAEKVDVPELTKALHKTLSDQETVRLEAIKTRSVSVDNIQMGAGDSKDFLHVTVKLLKGRDLSLRETMAKNIFEKIRDVTGDVSFASVEVAELQTYVKEG